MSRETECWRSVIASKSNEFVEEFRKNSRILYSRGYLLLANLELPLKFDRSTFSELVDSAPEHPKLPCLESPPGRIPGDSSIGSSESWFSCKVRSNDKSADNYDADTCLDVPAITNKQNLPPICPAVCKSVESPYSAREVFEKCHAEGCLLHQPLLLQANASTDSSIDDQGLEDAFMEYRILGKKEMGSHVDYLFKSKETEVEDLLHVKSVGSDFIQKNLSSPDPWSHKSPSNSTSCSNFAAPGFSFTGARSTSPFHGSNKSTGSDIIQQYLSSPDPWFQIYQFTSWSHLVFLAHVNAPNTYNDPWKIHHYLFAGFSSPSGHLPMNLQKSEIESSVEVFQSLRIPEADDCCPDLDKILSVEPSIYHHLFQTPSSNQVLNMRKRLSLDYQTTVKCTMDGGIRGLADIQPQGDPIILGHDDNESGSSSDFFKERSSSEGDGVVEGEEDLEAERKEARRKWLEDTKVIPVFEQLEGDLIRRSDFTLFRSLGYCSFARSCRDCYQGELAAAVQVTTPHVLWPWWPKYDSISYVGSNGRQLNPMEMKWADFKAAIDHAVVHPKQEGVNRIVTVRKFGAERKMFHIPERSLTTSKTLDFILHFYHSAYTGREIYDDGVFPLDLWPLYTIVYIDYVDRLLERPNILPYLEPFEQQGLDEDLVNLLEGNEPQEEVINGGGSEEEGMEEEVEEEEAEKNEVEVDEDAEWREFTSKLRYIDVHPI